MKIALAQKRNKKGAIEENIQEHLVCVKNAIKHGAQAVFFAELSLTNYEPGLARELGILSNDSRLDVFQQMSNDAEILIGVGAPIRMNGGVCIGLLIYKPQSPVQVYAKRFLHEDELPYFEPGKEQIIIEHNGCRIAPAICYESLLSEHIEDVCRLGTDIYLASVAKPRSGVDKAHDYYPKIAHKYNVAVLMVNCIGPCDTFESVGQSGIWSRAGQFLGGLESEIGLVIYDVSADKVSCVIE